MPLLFQAFKWRKSNSLLFPSFLALVVKDVAKGMTLSFQFLKISCGSLVDLVNK